MSILDIKLPGELLFTWRAPLELVSNSMREDMTNNDMNHIATIRERNQKFLQLQLLMILWDLIRCRWA
jgi:hypothetical protein